MSVKLRSQKYAEYIDLLKNEESELNTLVVNLASLIKMSITKNSKCETLLIFGLIKVLLIRFSNVVRSEKPNCIRQISEEIAKEFRRDPSVFEVVFYYSLFLFMLGENSRSSQLFQRLMSSGWSLNSEAKKLYSDIEGLFKNDQ